MEKASQSGHVTRWFLIRSIVCPGAVKVKALFEHPPAFRYHDAEPPNPAGPEGGMRRLASMLLLLCALLLVQCQERGGHGDRDIVFREHEWGSRPGDLGTPTPVGYGAVDPRAREVVAARCVGYFHNHPEELDFRNIRFDEIVYKYYNDRLYEIVVLFHGDRNRYNAHVWLEARHGKEDEQDQKRSYSFVEDRLYWEGRDSLLTLGYTPIKEEGRIVFRSTRYDKFLKRCLREAVHSAR